MKSTFLKDSDGAIIPKKAKREKKMGGRKRGGNEAEVVYSARV